MNFDFRLYEGCLECWILNCWRQCLAVRYLDRASFKAVTVKVARAPVFCTEPSTWNRVSSVFWRAEILTSHCAAGIRFWARVLFLYLLKDYFLIIAAASPAVTVGRYPSMNETSRSSADDGGRLVKSRTLIFRSVYDAIRIIRSARPELQQYTMLSYLLLSLIILSCIFFVFYTLVFQLLVSSAKPYAVC